ncbi:hypothetical protein LVD15_10045 [Fulvivirga maritima]|uniref:hypothetical protein n=1 Tax=Fulvivirga maritima TaxID=2904247 RepID=UPI001F22BAF6|nr:hypothetical protein [Fulvivirga maritima]UII28743.1 hypothetical protein LVD15_10045 [Fulvivirga maritima]
MGLALQKTITLVLFIGIGLALKAKFSNKDQVTGIKNIILTIALPATIFVALMGVNIKFSLLILPLLALVFNVVIFLLTPVILKFFSIPSDSAKSRTIRMLLPSLAPGLSCFPFILEYLGDKPLADAALADVGNKIFGLIFLYIVAMNWYYKRNQTDHSSSSGKIKSLLGSLLKEPINIVIIVAIVLLSFNFTMDDLPDFLSNAFVRMSALMTPLVLMFIGLAVKVKKGGIALVVSMLCCRAGITLLLSAALIFGLGLTGPTALLAIVFPLSSCSFWPFAHMSAFSLKEELKDVPEENRTFDSELAVLVLACSLPFSTILILSILSSGALFVHLPVLIISGVALVAMGILPRWVKKLFGSDYKAQGEMVEQRD